MVSKVLIPPLFISHGGGPGFFMRVDPRSPFAEISQDSAAHKALLAVSASRTAYGLPEKPSAIVVVSAHWEEADGFHVYSVPKPPLFYDYYGFPASTYQLKYPAPGDVKLAHRVVELINKQEGCSKAVYDDKREGLDHGVFMPLLILYPEANIPIVQVSLKSSLDPREHFVLGQALSTLREDNILIMGSGQATHPMSQGGSALKTEQFMQTLNEAVTYTKLTESEREENLAKLWSTTLIRATHIPRTEHLIPLVVAAGAARGEAGRDLFRQDKDFRFMDGLFSMASYVFDGKDNSTC